MWKFATFLVLTNAQTISQLLANNPNLSKISAYSSEFPEWSDANARLTLFAPTDQAIESQGSNLIGPGYFYMNQFFDYRTHYIVLQDYSDPKKMLLWDNYEPAKNINPEIHIRYGLGNGQVRQIIPADNGVLFITDLAISPPSDPSKSLNFLGCSKFQKAIEDAGLMDLVDGLRGVTIFAPNDAAMDNAASVLAALSPSQVKATILYHIIPQVVYSTMMTTGTLPTLLAGNTIPVRSSSSGADVGPGPDTGRFHLADNFMTSGVTHRLGFVMIPPNLPVANAVVEPTNIPSGSVQPKGSDPKPTDPKSSDPKLPKKSKGEAIFVSWNHLGFGYFLIALFLTVA